MFKEQFARFNWETMSSEIDSRTSRDVEAALSKSGRRDLYDFMALISPAAEPYLEKMAELSSQLTKKRFGKTIQLFAPLYLSNECQNICTYCGFSMDNAIRRKTLSDEEILREAEALRQMGYEHVLLVTGEATQTVGAAYIRHAIELLRPLFAHISIEVQPLTEEEYASMTPYGLNTVLVYQETYRERTYRDYHPKGKKSNFNYRLDTPDRIGKAGMHKIGLGVLLGLEDWRTDSFFCALHLDYLERTYWQTRYSISFPRIRPHAMPEKGGLREGNDLMSDRQLVQLICAWRIYNEELELSISTRESEVFRNNIIRLGATTLSAGSKTNPGGYVVEPESLEQFEISDERSPDEVAEMIRSAGYEPVWKDWDKVLS